MKFIFLILIQVTITSFLVAQNFSLFERHEYVNLSGEKLPYRLLYPDNMIKDKQYPLFVYLHGKGKRGTDNQAQLGRGGELWLNPDIRKNYSAIVLYPQCPKTDLFMEKYDENNSETGLSVYGNMVIEVINQLIASGKIDKKRIYISGSSMGAATTFVMLALYPDLFAAATPICGATQVERIPNWAGKVALRLYHGEDDKIVPVEASRRIGRKLKELNVSVEYNEYRGVGHNCWDIAFADPNFISWFFQFSK